MIFRIPKSNHRARPLRFGIFWNKRSFRWVVKFTDSCRYDLGNEDQFDTNKLCGVGYIPGFHHKDSARFGWRYWTERKEIELSAYCYVNGRRVIQHIAFCEIGKEYRIELTKLSTMYFFQCSEIIDGWFFKNIGTLEMPYSNNKKLGYRLGVFFGGQSRAPHEMKIELTKV